MITYVKRKDGLYKVYRDGKRLGDTWRTPTGWVVDAWPFTGAMSARGMRTRKGAAAVLAAFADAR